MPFSIVEGKIQWEVDVKAIQEKSNNVSNYVSFCFEHIEFLDILVLFEQQK